MNYRLDDKTLEKLSNRHGLSYLLPIALVKHKKKKYMLVMRKRFPNEGDPSYAEEWAQRFAKDPYIYADYKTTRVLNSVMTKSSRQLDALLKKRHMKIRYE